MSMTNENLAVITEWAREVATSMVNEAWSKHPEWTKRYEDCFDLHRLRKEESERNAGN